MPGRGARLWREWRLFVGFVAVMLVFRSAIADWNQVPSGSMLPSILIGDRIVVDKLAYDVRVPFTHLRLVELRAPRRGDIVTFTSPEDGRLLVKRIVAVGGDDIALAGNRLSVNGQDAEYVPVTDADPGLLAALAMPEGYGLFRESLLDSERQVMLRIGYSDHPAAHFPRIRVPDGHYLMLGDNRENSRDSRALGFIERERILGRAHAVAFSLDYENHYAPRMNRLLADLE